MSFPRLHSQTSNNSQHRFTVYTYSECAVSLMMILKQVENCKTRQKHSSFLTVGQVCGSTTYITHSRAHQSQTPSHLLASYFTTSSFTANIKHDSLDWAKKHHRVAVTMKPATNDQAVKNLHSPKHWLRLENKSHQFVSGNISWWE